MPLPLSTSETLTRQTRPYYYPTSARAIQRPSYSKLVGNSVYFLCPRFHNGLRNARGTHSLALSFRPWFVLTQLYARIQSIRRRVSALARSLARSNFHVNVPTQSPPLQGSRALSRPSGPCLSHDGDLPSIGTIRGSTMTNRPADLASTMRSSSAWQGTSPAPDRWSRPGEALLARVPDVKEVIGSPRPSHLSGQGSDGGAMRSSRREGRDPSGGTKSKMIHDFFESIGRD